MENIVNKLTGKVKWYDSQRGFGLILGSDGKEYFVHSSQLSSKIGKVKIGIRLIFEIMPRPRKKGGYEATHVELDTPPLMPPALQSIGQPPKPAVNSGDDYRHQSCTTATTANGQPDPKKPIETKVVGVTYEGRQSIIALLGSGSLRRVGL
jgi:CspA family cold shock protein